MKFFSIFRRVTFQESRLYYLDYSYKVAFSSGQLVSNMNGVISSAFIIVWDSYRLKPFLVNQDQFFFLKQSVTLGDEEARKRKVQKTILERKGPPTFTCAVEMISKTECRVHHRLDATVDAILAGSPWSTFLCNI